MARDIPIIFSAPMVRAMLAGEKTVTRRLLYSKRNAKGGVIPATASILLDGKGSEYRPGIGAVDEYFTLSGWEKVEPGDRLWVRESLARSPERHWRYAADGAVILMERTDPRCSAMVAWAHHKEGISAPSIHMPQWASRLTLMVTAKWIERLQAIDMDDARMEGAVSRSAFSDLWDTLHQFPNSWDDNPWIVGLRFTVHKQNIDAMAKAA